MTSAARPRLRWFQYSLRSLFIGMFLACIGMSWVSVKMQQARQQREVVEKIWKLGGSVQYDYMVSGPRPAPPRPAWLRNLLGQDFFASVVGVELNSSSVTDADLNHLNRLPQFRMLWFNGTLVSDVGLEHLKGVAHLRGLGLNGTRVTDAGLENLKEMTQLRNLELGSTKVTDTGLEHLSKLTQLRVVGLCSTKVTDAGLEHLKGLNQLQTLVLTETKVTDEGVTRLQQALPNCEIYQHGP